MDFFLWRHLKEPVHAVPPRTIENFEARLQAVVTTVDVDMLRHVPDNSAWRTAAYLESYGGCMEHLLLPRGACAV
jgi:hypothetical protein